VGIKTDRKAVHGIAKDLFHDMYSSEDLFLLLSHRN
jgi:hypothetical protein